MVFEDSSFCLLIFCPFFLGSSPFLFRFVTVTILFLIIHGFKDSVRIDASKSFPMLSKSAVRKLLQQHFYSLLHSRRAVVLSIFTVSLLLFSFLQFGDTLLEWSVDKYRLILHTHQATDNILEKSFEDSICYDDPVDVVYTWVNGSDPWHQKQLETYRREHVGGEFGAKCKQKYLPLIFELIFFFCRSHESRLINRRKTWNVVRFFSVCSGKSCYHLSANFKERSLRSFRRNSIFILVDFPI